MKQRARIYYNEKQKSQMWGRWKKGESLQVIAILFDRHRPPMTTIFSVSLLYLSRVRIVPKLH